MIRILRPLLVSALAVSTAACAPAATVGAEADAAVSADAAGGVSLVNEAEARRAMDMFYDPLLRDAGVTGIVVVDVALEVDGSVRAARVVRSTHVRFTDSAERTARILEFTPQAEPGVAVRVRMEFIHRSGEITVVAP
jgi:TonB family protein